ncbi:FtsX-like permease family protein [candidate division KSB1 bacterium]|nr:FtsX-like permease family protein [candidate division KSB1 bacterium]
MINFLIKGLIRDRSRSLFPLLIVAAGVMLTVLLFCWLGGVADEFLWSSAAFNTGHVKIMTQAYSTEEELLPNDLALVGVDSLLGTLRNDYPDLYWTPRIRFGGLLDIPDEQNETRAQGPAIGLAIDLLNISSPEKRILNLEKALKSGRFPENAYEILMSEEFAEKLNVKPGDRATLISSTAFGAMAIQNFIVSGTIRFGVMAMDRGAIIADISGIQMALDMPNGASEVLGIFTDFQYRHASAERIAAGFNQKHFQVADDFSPVMATLLNQSGMGDYYELISSASLIAIAIFIMAMSLVLWNAGLMGSLRRYGEIGVRLAIGETKRHVYWSLIGESLFTGIAGTILGTALGLAASYYLQIKGIDISYAMKNASMTISNVIRAKVTSASYLIGFLPGLLATLLGAAISGIGIYRRQTSQLFKELEV